jgi:hypothetical protein
MKGLMIVFSLMLLGLSARSQEAVRFIDTVQQKTILAKPGDFLIIRYKGYLGQTEFFKHTLQGVTDSSLYVGIVHPYSPMSTVFAGGNNPWKEIKFKDIESFKRRSASANMLKSLIGISAGLSAIFLLKDLNERNAYSDGKNLAISLGVGLGINIGMNLLFSDRPKYKIKDGWHIETVKKNN